MDTGLTASLRGQLGVASVIAALFNFYGIPGSIGADLDPSIMKGLQAGIGMAGGLTAYAIIFMKKIDLTWPVLWGDWFGPKHGTGDNRSGAYYRATLFAFLGAVMGYLLFPDNQYIQAAFVFGLPNSAAYGDF